jgi:hypothetical protein
MSSGTGLSNVILFREITPAKNFCWCVLTGNLADGFKVHGPFVTRGEAEAWAKRSGKSWLIMELEPVNEDMN